LFFFILPYNHKHKQKEVTNMHYRVDAVSESTVIASHGSSNLYKLTGGASVLPLLVLKGSRAEAAFSYGFILGEKIALLASVAVAMYAEELGETAARAFFRHYWAHLAQHVDRLYLEEIENIVRGAREAGVDLSEEDLAALVCITNCDFDNAPGTIEVLLTGKGEDHSPSQVPPSMSCTALAAWGSRTEGGRLMAFRNLDWISQSGMHEFRLATVYALDECYPFFTCGYIGCIGALSGMNAAGITIGEIGAFNTCQGFSGTPWTLITRKILEQAMNQDEASVLMTTASHTLGYNYVIGWGDPGRYRKVYFSPSGRAYETCYKTCEEFADNDRKEAEAFWTDAVGVKHYYGTPLPEAVFRADTAFSSQVRITQTADGGPGNPGSLGDPSQTGEVNSYLDCHLPMRDMLETFRLGGSYIYPPRGITVLDNIKHRLIGRDEMICLAGTVAHNTEMLCLNDWNVMSVVYDATLLKVWIAFESFDNNKWSNAPDSGYLELDLPEIWGA
jgi:hypothetical protein